MKNRFGIWTLAAILCAALVQAGRAQDDAEAMKAKLIKTYAGLQTYQSTSTFEQRQANKANSWRAISACDMKVAFDRRDGKVTYTRPDFQIYDDGVKLRAASDGLTGRYLELPAPNPLTFDSLSDQVSFAFRPTPVELVLLLSPDPLKTIHGGEVTAMRTLPPDPDDPQKRPGLESTSAMGKLTLRMDPASGLVTTAIFAMNLPGSDPGAYNILEYDMKIDHANQPVADDRFALDTKGSKAFTSVQDWSGQGQDQGQDQGQAQQAPPDPALALVGRPAPPVALKTLDGKDYKLADDKSAVVIFDFWATWCGPCRMWLPHLESVQAWAQKNNKPVAIYAVDVQETPDVVQAFVNESKLTLPVLMDAQGAIAQAYLAQGIPETVMIAHGQVVHVHVGFDPNGDDAIIKEINEQLAGPATQPAK